MCDKGLGGGQQGCGRAGRHIRGVVARANGPACMQRCARQHWHPVESRHHRVHGLTFEQEEGDVEGLELGLHQLQAAHHETKLAGARPHEFRDLWGAAETGGDEAGFRG